MANWVNHSSFKKNWNGNQRGWKKNNYNNNFKKFVNIKHDSDEEDNNLLINSQDIAQLPKKRCLNNNYKQSVSGKQPVMWTLYFPEEQYLENSGIVKNIEIFHKFFLLIKSNLNLESLDVRMSIEIDFSLLLADKNIMEHLPGVKDKFKHDPELYLRCLSAAAYQFLEEFDKENMMFCEVNYLYMRLQCRIINFDTPTPLQLLKANYYGKFITVKGTVVRSSSYKPICLQMAYQCSVCAAIQTVRWLSGKCVQPTSCSSTGCRSRTFNPLRNNPKTLTVDCQTIRLYEQNDETRELGRIPRTVECELTADLG